MAPVVTIVTVIFVLAVRTFVTKVLRLHSHTRSVLACGHFVYIHTYIHPYIHISWIHHLFNDGLNMKLVKNNDGL